jgi:quercetin dioxygenase-like cupin family protein
MVGAYWSLVSSDLNLNLVRLGAGEEVAPHINAEVDVVGLVVAGEGTLSLEERAEPLRAGQLFFVPKGARRGIQAAGDELVYLTCHRRRGALTIGRGGWNP